MGAGIEPDLRVERPVLPPWLLRPPTASSRALTLFPSDAAAGGFPKVDPLLLRGPSTAFSFVPAEATAVITTVATTTVLQHRPRGADRSRATPPGEEPLQVLPERTRWPSENLRLPPVPFGHQRGGNCTCTTPAFGSTTGGDLLDRGGIHNPSSCSTRAVSRRSRTHGERQA